MQKVDECNLKNKLDYNLSNYFSILGNTLIDLGEY